MIDEIVLKRILSGWIRLVYSSPSLLWLDQNTIRPEKPYWGLRLPSIIPNDNENRYGMIDDDNLKLSIENEFTLEVYYYGDNPLQYLNHLYFSTKKFEVKHYFKTNKIAFINKIGLTFDPTVIDNQNEPRGSMDYRFRIMDIENDNTGHFNSVQITGISNAAENIQKSSTININ